MPVYSVGLHIVSRAVKLVQKAKFYRFFKKNIKYKSPIIGFLKNLLHVIF